MLHVAQRLLPGAINVQVSLTERKRGLRFSRGVAKLAANGERVLKMTEGFPIAHPGQRKAELAECPGLAEQVTDLAHALCGNAQGGHAVRPDAPSTEQCV